MRLGFDIFCLFDLCWVWNCFVVVSNFAISGVCSGFEDEFKRHWLGETYWLPGIEGNDLSRTNVSNIRLQYRSVLPSRFAVAALSATPTCADSVAADVAHEFQIS